MKEYRFLRVLDKFQGFYERFGVDYAIMRKILALKLTMDERRVPTIMQGNESKDNIEKNNFFKSLIFYGFMGLFIGILTFSKLNKMYVYSIVLSAFMFIILTVFISDFSSVLLDVRDKNLIGIRGVSNRTINAAKITHICYYVFFISLALGWLAIIGSFYSGILTGLIFLLEIIIIDIFMIVITALLYLVVLKYFNGEKVKDIINVFQIFLTIAMAVGYQLVVRVFEFVDLSVIYNEKPWNVFFPPMWFAAPIYLVNGGGYTAILVVLSFLAVIIPLVSIILYIKYSKNFENYLVKLNSSYGNEKEKKKSIFFKLGYYFCRNNEEKAFYTFSNSIIKKERDFKLKVYPSLGLGVAFPLMFIFIFSLNYNYSNDFSIVTALRNIKESKLYLWLYFFSFMIPNLMIMLQYSKCYKGAWIYKAVKINNIANIYKGCYKSFMFNLLLPLYVCECIVFIILFGFKVIPSLIVIILYSTLLIPIFFKVNKFTLPFADEFKAAEGGSGIANMLLSFLIIGIGVGLHWLVSTRSILILVYMGVLIGVNYIQWRNKSFIVK